MSVELWWNDANAIKKECYVVTHFQWSGSVILARPENSPLSKHQKKHIFIYLFHGSIALIGPRPPYC